MYLAVCIIFALCHMVMLIFYPYFLIRKFLTLRKRIKNNHGCLRLSMQNKPTSEK